MSLRVLVVDDSALYRQLVRNVLRNVPDVEVVGIAKSGVEALERIPQLQPQLLTLDVQMPGMNGLELLGEIKKKRLPVKAIMLSSLTSEGAQVTTDALLAGAFDFIQKPCGPDANSNRSLLESLLIEKINAFRESLSVSLPRSTGPVTAHARAAGGEMWTGATVENRVSGTQVTKSRSIDAVLIGTSTGGPIALREVIPRLPASLDVPVLVVQHMPPGYTKSLASRINEVSLLPVHEADNGMLVQANNVYIAPGGLHMGFQSQRGKIVIQTTEDPPEHNCRPAVDYMFRSGANVYSGNLLAVIMTGMGRDGTEGCRLIKQMGGFVLTQHPDGCVVYGMPKAIVEEQLADRVVPLEKIGAWIVHLVEANRKTRTT